MKKTVIALFLVFSLLLCACSQSAPTDENTDGTNNGEGTGTTESTTSHSRFYLPGYFPHRILQYFNEVVLSGEYTDNTGSASLIQKWTKPILYRIEGTPTDEDISVLNTLFAQLNEIQGFPGIEAAADGVKENLMIYFLAPDAFRDKFSSTVHGEDAYGAAQFWYDTNTNEILNARIGYRTDMEYPSRKSVLLEEIVNCLGLSDSELRTDSVVYQHSNDNTYLSDVDWLILKLLYEPTFKCGMNAKDCAAIFNVLYY